MGSSEGLSEKYVVSRSDGRDAPGEKHEGCLYFVLDITHDRHALPALVAYARSCGKEKPALAYDLRMTVVDVLTEDADREADGRASERANKARGEAV